MEGTERIKEMKDPSNPVCRTISTLLSRIGDKWTVLVVQTLGDGSKRFNELRREIAAAARAEAIELGSGQFRNALGDRIFR